MKQGSFKTIHRLADTVMNFKQPRHLLLRMAFFFFFKRERKKESKSKTARSSELLPLKIIHIFYPLSIHCVSQ